MSTDERRVFQVKIDDAARKDLVEVTAHYDAQREGLGDKFLAAFRKTVEGIRAFPNASPSMSQRSRRCRITRFPYGVLYQIRGDTIAIIAVAHLHRSSRVWHDRERDSD